MLSTSKLLALAPRSVRTVCHVVFRPLLPSRLLECCKSFPGFLVCLVKVLLLLLGLEGAFFFVFLWLLAHHSMHLVIADHWLHVLFTGPLGCFRVQDVSTVLVDNVEAFSCVRNFLTFLDCCSVSGDFSDAARLEDCHRSSVCTLRYRQDRPRCIRHIDEDSHSTSITSCELDISPRTVRVAEDHQAH